MVLGGVVVSTDIVGGANQVVGDIYLGSFFLGGRDLLGGGIPESLKGDIFSIAYFLRKLPGAFWGEFSVALYLFGE